MRLTLLTTLLCCLPVAMGTAGSSHRTFYVDSEKGLDRHSNTADTSGFEVKHNLFYQWTDWGSRYTGGWKTLPEMHHNLWYSDSGIMAWVFQKKLTSFEEYQNATGLDSDSVFADPKIIAPEQGDYRPAPDSPAGTLRAGRDVKL
ncbi:hypothetical protein [Novipirellula artificiosorum]|uniref:Uncharacterized protein n=1 Tax=Novipirellula artificiosorum TaxID=2528016 RepID=A0A5C6D5M1_9BACT|nr:hypothetical protein [Novipirellula artificiosorum]TWU31335.1 hypothetical protein Poly41_62040 [Novipirellula artificiosorum]